MRLRVKQNKREGQRNLSSFNSEDTAKKLSNNQRREKREERERENKRESETEGENKRKEGGGIRPRVKVVFFFSVKIFVLQVFQV